MGWEVVFSPRSEADLQTIVSYIAPDNRAAAIRFGELLITKSQSLANAPKMGAVMAQRPGTRFLPVGAYLIIYRPDERRRVVRILRFWHASRGRRPAR